MERNHSVPVPAMRMDDPMFKDTPGAFNIEVQSEHHIHILCECPCGCGGAMRLPLHRPGQRSAVHTKASWEWDGSLEKPTLQPSIRDLAGCKYHGFLTAGMWTFCEDSGK